MVHKLQLSLQFAYSTRNQLLIREIKGHFYKIKNSEGKVLGNLLGTAHLIDSSVSKLNPEINLAIEKSKRVFFEVKEFDQLTADANKKLDQKIGKMPVEDRLKAIEFFQTKLEGKTIFGLSWTELQQKTEELDQTNALKLYILQSGRLDKIMEGKFDKNGDEYNGIDDLVFNQSKRLGKEIFGLESLEEHFKTLDSIQSEITIDLKPHLESEVYDSMARKIGSDWASGKPCINFSNDPNSKDYQISEVRSKKMGDKIFEDLTKNGEGGLYVFGSDHLYDGENVIQNLQNRGLTIERI